MSPNPPSNNKYGGQVPVTFVGQTLVASSLIDITNHLAHWNVTLSPLIRPDGTPIVGAALFATIAHRATVQWGNGGMQDTAVMDWPMRGGTFQVAGSSLNVFGSCLIQGIFSSGGSNQLPEVQFRAHASPASHGPRHTWQSPTCSLTFGTIAGFATAADQRVPAFAKRFYIFYSNTTLNQAVEIRWLDHGAVPGVVRFDQLQNNAGAVGCISHYDDPWMVPPSAMWIRLTNPNGGAVDGVTVVFELDLG